MKQTFAYITILFVMLFSSCVAEEDIIIQDDSMVNIGLSYNLYSTNSPIRILVADSLTGYIVANHYLIPSEENNEQFSIKVRTGLMNFYLLANEPDRLTSQLNRIKHKSELSNLYIDWSELALSDDVSGTSPVLTTFPALQKASGYVRQSENNPEVGEISTDNATWNLVLHMSLERLAVKISLAVRKSIDIQSTPIEIRDIEVSHFPNQGYLLPRSYEGGEFQSFTPVKDLGELLTSGYDPNISDENTYIWVLEDFIIPEYIMANPTQKDKATYLKIKTLYNGKRVYYHIPVRGDLSVDDYSLTRNKHYRILATIKSDGSIDYTPEIEYKVADWDGVYNGKDYIEDAVIVFQEEWDANTKMNGSNIFVEGDEVVEFRFNLSSPPGSTWSATLSNPVDFMFDYSGNAVSQGIAKSGPKDIIRIKPRRETTLNNPHTEFYITVHNGIKNVELDLFKDNSGDRYIITQIPK